MKLTLLAFLFSLSTVAAQAADAAWKYATFTVVNTATGSIHGYMDDGRSVTTSEVAPVNVSRTSTQGGPARSIAHYLNYLASQGWEVTAAVSLPGASTQYVLRRPAKSDGESGDTAPARRRSE